MKTNYNSQDIRNKFNEVVATVNADIYIYPNQEPHYQVDTLEVDGSFKLNGEISNPEELNQAFDDEVTRMIEKWSDSVRLGVLRTTANNNSRQPWLNTIADMWVDENEIEELAQAEADLASFARYGW